VVEGLVSDDRGGRLGSSSGDQSRHGCEHANLSAPARIVLGWRLEEAAVAGTLLGGNEQLASVADRRCDQRGQGAQAGLVVDEELGGEIVGTVDDESNPVEERLRVRFGEPFGASLEPWSDVSAFGEALDLGPADVGAGELDLALKIRALDNDVVADANRSAGVGGEREHQRSADRAGAYNQDGHARCLDSK